MEYKEVFASFKALILINDHKQLLECNIYIIPPPNLFATFDHSVFKCL